MNGATAGTATILFTDLVGSTELRSALGDAVADQGVGRPRREALQVANGVAVQVSPGRRRVRRRRALQHRQRGDIGLEPQVEPGNVGDGLHGYLPPSRTRRLAPP